MNIIHTPTTVILTILAMTVQGQNWPLGSRQAAMGSTGVTQNDIWAIHYNQAGLAFLEHPTAGFHFENKFFIQEMALRAGVFAYPTTSGTFGLCISYFGYSQFNQSKIGLAYALKLGKFFSAGIQLDYLNTYLEPEYGNKGAAVGEIGLLSQPVKNLYIGAHLFNPTRSKIADYNDERIPTILQFGIGYNFSDKVYLAVETEKDLDYPIEFKAGLEYHFLKNLSLRAGVSSDPGQSSYGTGESFNSTQPSFGIGYFLQGFQADIAFTDHPVLGLTPHFSMSYAFGSSKNAAKN